jgi:hypothetical protein
MRNATSAGVEIVGRFGVVTTNKNVATSKNRNAIRARRYWVYAVNAAGAYFAGSVAHTSPEPIAIRPARLPAICGTFDW